MNLKVVKHEADEEEDVFKVTLKGESGDLVDNMLLAVELRLKGKVEDVIDKFPRGSIFEVKLTAK